MRAKQTEPRPKDGVIASLRMLEAERAVFTPYAQAMDADEFISSFGGYVEASNAGIFVGAGLSLGAGYPDWFELTEPFRRELGVEGIDDLPQLVQYYQDNVDGGRERVEGHVRRTIAAVPVPDPAGAALRAQHLIADLPVESIWTTNYDPLLEEVVPESLAIETDDELAALIAPGARRILKMHGSVPRGWRAGDPTTSLVIARDDYDRYPQTHPRFWQLLQAEFLTRSFLFVGFGFTDPNAQLIFKMVRLSTPAHQRQHFAVLRRPTEVSDQRVYELRLGEFHRVGIDVIEIAEYQELDVLLHRLVARCRPMRVLVSGSPVGDKRPTAVGAYPTAPVPEEIEALAKALGSDLATTDIRLMAGGQVGAQVSYELLRQLQLRGRYDADRFVLVRRAQEAELDPPNLRLGQILFTGDEPSDLRAAAFREVRAVLVVGGGDGTRAEIAQASDLGLGLVPLGMSGGAAAEAWGAIDAAFGAYRLGGRPADRRDFELLNQPDPAAASAAAVRLLDQALFQPSEGR